MIDFLAVLILVLSTLWGLVRGALRDLLGLAALGIAYVTSAAFADSVGQLIARRADIRVGLGYTFGRVAAGVAVYVSLKVSFWMVNRKFGETSEGITRRWNRNLGALAGFVYGVVLVLIALFLLDSVAKAFPGSESGLVARARSSKLRGLVKGHNPADRFLVTDSLRLLQIAREDPEVLDRLAEDQRVAPLLEDPTVQALAEDEEFMQAVREKRVHEVLGNEDFRALLKDKELLKRVLSPELSQAIREAVEAAKEREGAPTAQPRSTER